MVGRPRFQGLLTVQEVTLRTNKRGVRPEHLFVLRRGRWQVEYAQQQQRGRRVRVASGAPGAPVSAVRPQVHARRGAGAAAGAGVNGGAASRLRSCR